MLVIQFFHIPSVKFIFQKMYKDSCAINISGHTRIKYTSVREAQCTKLYINIYIYISIHGNQALQALQTNVERSSTS